MRTNKNKKTDPKESAVARFAAGRLLPKAMGGNTTGSLPTIKEMAKPFVPAFRFH
jgi:hypothetical protein